MTEKTITVAALVIDNGILTFYKLDGTPYVVTQGDPRGLKMYQEYIDQKSQGKEQIVLAVGPEDYTVAHLTSKNRNPLIRFFRARIDDVKRLFGNEEYSTELAESSHEEAAARIRDVAARLYKAQENSQGPVEELPVKVIHSEDPMTENDTIIAVTETGIVTGVENLTDQFAAGEEGKAPAQGPDNLILRLSKISDKRGHTADELMRFVKGIDLPILPDGSFLAYKRLLHIGNGVYVDPHSKKVHQRIGDIVQMDEKLVDPSRRTLCSTGLHIGSRHYMGGFHSNAEGSGTMLVLVQPEDAIAVPRNESTKARVTRYLILADLSNKAHELVNNNKRVDDCQQTMKIIAEIVAGARPPMLGIVNIGNAMGGNLSYTINGKQVPTSLPLIEARAASQAKAQAPSTEVKPVRTIDDSIQGNQSNLTPKKIRNEESKVKPIEVAKAQPVKKDPAIDAAAVLYARMTDKDNSTSDRRAAAQELIAHQKKHKLTYGALGLPTGAGDEAEEIIVMTQPPAPAPKPKTQDKVKAKPEPKSKASKAAPLNKAQASALSRAESTKKLPVEAAKPKLQAPKESRQDRARRLWDIVQTSKDKTHIKKAAQELRNFKKTAKVSWEALGLGKYNVEATLKTLLD